MTRAFSSRARPRAECWEEGLDAFPTPLSPPSTPSQTLVPRPVERGRSPWCSRAVASSNRHIYKTKRAREGSPERRRPSGPPTAPLSSLDVNAPPFPTLFERPCALSQTLQPPPIDGARSLERIETGLEVNGRLENSRLREHPCRRRSRRQAKAKDRDRDRGLPAWGRNIAKRLYFTRRYARTISASREGTTSRKSKRESEPKAVKRARKVAKDCIFGAIFVVFSPISTTAARFRASALPFFDAAEHSASNAASGGERSDAKSRLFQFFLPTRSKEARVLISRTQAPLAKTLAPSLFSPTRSRSLQLSLSLSLSLPFFLRSPRDGRGLFGDSKYQSTACSRHPPTTARDSKDL